MSKVHAYLEHLKLRASRFHEELRKHKSYHWIQTYGEGLSAKEIESFLRRDTAQAYAFFRRDYDKDPEKDRTEADRLNKAVVTARDLFLSFLLKLTPARRLFYGTAVVLFVWGLVGANGWGKIGLSFLILNLLLALELADKLLAKDELEIARSIQFSLQPAERPRLERLRLSCHYQPAREVGGDYYDFSMVDESRFTIILGDVSGKGMPAALYAVKLQALFELLGKTRIGPKDMLVQMNEVICEKIRRDYFITAVVGMVDLGANRLLVARAGHNHPLHFSAAAGTATWLKPKGLGIGMKKNPDFGHYLEEGTVPLGAEDLLLFYTDGITEAMNRRDEEFGCGRLERVVVENAHRNVDEIKERLLWQVDRFTEGTPSADDVTLVIARIAGP